MRRDQELSHYERCMIELYESDPSIAYDLNPDEQQTLLALVGEDEVVIDAILKNSGASKKARAEAIGVQESDFDYED
jgi:hypothetical protein